MINDDVRQRANEGRPTDGDKELVSDLLYFLLVRTQERLKACEAELAAMKAEK